MIKNNHFSFLFSVTINPLINETGWTMGAQGNQCTMHCTRQIYTQLEI